MTQPPTLNLDQFLPYRLSVTSNRVSGRIAGAYAALFGLSIPEWRLIAVVAEGGSLSQQGVCARTQMDKVTISRAAIALAARHLISRTAHPHDRRSYLLSLSADGQELYASIAPKALAMERQAFACLSMEEQRQLMAMLDRIDAHVGALDSSTPLP